MIASVRNILYLVKIPLIDGDGCYFSLLLRNTPVRGKINYIVHVNHM